MGWEASTANDLRSRGNTPEPVPLRQAANYHLAGDQYIHPNLNIKTFQEC